MKIMIVGADGQLGSDLVRVFGQKTDWSILPLTIKDLDITDIEASRRIIESSRPDVIINTAGYIQVDLCEENMDAAFRINAFAQKHMAELSKAYQVKYCLMSTDYVFDGQKFSAYVETDTPRPINMYGVSKLAGEQIVAYVMDQYLIIRVSGLYGPKGPLGKKCNFVEMILEKARNGDALRVVDDQIQTPTYTVDVAEHLIKLLPTDHTGIFHLTNEGSCSWHEFAEEILRQCGAPNTVKIAKTGDFGELARRPCNSVLRNQHLEKLGLNSMPHWKEALHQYLITKGHLNLS